MKLTAPVVIITAALAAASLSPAAVFAVGSTADAGAIQHGRSELVRPAPRQADHQVGTAARGDASTNPPQKQVQALAKFNGYYALNSTGAFFYVNTTLHVARGGAKQKYVVSLASSLDGTTSKTVPFTGSFTGRRLIQKPGRGISFDLKFKRLPKSIGPTATITGTIKVPGQRKSRVSGTTYSNPTPPSFWGWGGTQTYYLPADPGGKPTPLAKIRQNGEILSDGGVTGGKLTKVQKYSYNFDMYYFSFKNQQEEKEEFVMGTAGEAGLTMNNMSYRNGALVSQRDPVTLPTAVAPTPQIADLQPKTPGQVTLADFSGYYPIPTKKHPKAFVAIQGTDFAYPALTSDSLYQVLVSVSLDGQDVQSWYYDVDEQMSFDGRTLRMPQQGIRVSLVREYNPEAQSLFRMSGTIQQRRVRALSTFNPIPVAAFAGTMTDTAGQHKLAISASGAVELDGQVITDYEYVPTMYILAGPIPETSPMKPTLLSLGYNGGKGVTAIVTTNYETTQAETFVLNSIPSG